MKKTKKKNSASIRASSSIHLTQPATSHIPSVFICLFTVIQFFGSVNMHNRQVKVWPNDRIIPLKSGEINIPITTAYAHNRNDHSFFIQSRNNSLPTIKFKNSLYQGFSNIEIFFTFDKKIKVITCDAFTADSIAANVSLNNTYIAHIPSEYYEILGVASIQIQTFT